MNIVPTDKSYTYDLLTQNLFTLNRVFPFLNIQVVGNSVLGKNLYVVKLGTGSKKVFYSASFHANEWITSVVMMKFIEDYCNAYVNNLDLFNNCSIYIMPMVNPDGFDLVTGNLSKNSSAFIQAQNITLNYPNIPFPSGWKANILGTDLNLQFPAEWQKAKEIKYSQGFTSPAPRDFVGLAPLIEPEAKAIYDFTLLHNFDLIIAYHTQGQEIYWNFQNIDPLNGYKIGEKLANASGYLLTKVPYNSSFAGYKDWFILYFDKPGYTIEAGLGENPLPISQFNEIYNDNLGILILGAVS